MEKMNMRSFCSLVAVILMVVAQASFGAVTVVAWDQADANWNDPANWAGGSLPDSDDFAVIKNDGICNLNTTVSLGRVIAADYTGSGTLNVLPGADLTTTSEMAIGDHGDAVPNTLTGVVNQTGGAVKVSTNLYIANRGASGEYKISGGTLNVTGNIYLDKTASNDATAKFTVIGGDATITCAKLYMQNDSIVEFVITDTGVSTITTTGFSYVADSTVELSVKLDESASFATGDVFTLIDGAANLAGVFGNYANDDIVQIGGVDTFRVNYDVGNNNLLTLTAVRDVPEPATMAIVGLGGFGAIVCKRK